jgi:hypothetical protein
MIYCLSVRDDTILWNRVIDPNVDRLSIHPTQTAATLFASCFFLIDHTTLSSPYPDRFFKRPRLPTEAAVICI